MKTKTVVAIGVGAALFSVFSAVQIPIGPNTGFRLAPAILVIFGSFFGPIAGFFIGLIGHALTDALLYGGVWWSWVLMSATMGLFAGLIQLHKDFSLDEGEVTGKHIGLMVYYNTLGVLFGGIIAVLGDVKLYKEPFDKSKIQVIAASPANLLVLLIVGVGSVVIIAKSKKNSRGFDN